MTESAPESRPDSRPDSRRLLALTVDLDPLSAYSTIHGLGPVREEHKHIVLEKAVGRFLKALEGLNARATFFVVGADLEGGPAEVLEEVVAAGHELANHSQNHRYDLLRVDPGTLEREIRTAHTAIEKLTGSPPCGFRSPGYGASGPLFAVLESLGYRYDSSLLPSPPYYLAKGAVMAKMALTGNPSGAIMHDPRLLLAPRGPYRPDRSKPWKKGASSLVELPVSVAGGSGLPLTGTLLAVAPEILQNAMARSVHTAPLINLEFHGIDMMDTRADNIPPRLADRQPDLKIPLLDKLIGFNRFLQMLLATHRPVTLAEAAEHYQARL